LFGVIYIKEDFKSGGRISGGNRDDRVKYSLCRGDSLVLLLESLVLLSDLVELLHVSKEIVASLQCDE